MSDQPKEDKKLSEEQGTLASNSEATPEKQPEAAQEQAVKAEQTAETQVVEQTQRPVTPEGPQGKPEGPGSAETLADAAKQVGNAADLPDKIGAATPEQQAEAAAKQAADTAKQTTAEPSDAPAAELKGPSDAEKEAKAKAAAEARAARANARAQKTEAAEGAPAAEPEGSSDAEKEAKAKAAAEARAARASARAQKTDAAEDAAPKEPSPKQPLLDRAVQILKEQVGEDAVTEAFINEKDGHRPYLIIHADRWTACAKVLKNHEEFQLDYLRNVAGSDMETHLEAVYHLLSLKTNNEFCVKVKTNRETPSIPSVTPIWATANWNEREIYDLLGIDFPGHPDLRRIMMPDDWVGHPLRKDYEAIDPEV
ncbi:NADH-quinone oxidoreductase subunit C [Paenibacillus hamazuiensis]|uniref:NADH-quinone oxidoreductase subunit C n=1 Tax=Paenibacillus hamazuiensis TaxID=2936508 RepID=UPI00200D3B27|nr:NADH-quinone oxidoreductase subunit C [Paenibacillus hamazuiensis]